MLAMAEPDSTRDTRLGQLALSQAGLSAIDLESALLLQRERERMGRPQRLGELLVELGFLPDAVRAALLAHQREARAERRAGDPGAPGEDPAKAPRPGRLGWVAFCLGDLGARELAELLSAQEADGKRLGEAMVSSGKLTEQRRDQLLELQTAWRTVRRLLAAQRDWERLRDGFGVERMREMMRLLLLPVEGPVTGEISTRRRPSDADAPAAEGGAPSLPASRRAEIEALHASLASEGGGWTLDALLAEAADPSVGPAAAVTVDEARLGGLVGADALARAERIAARFVRAGLPRTVAEVLREQGVLTAQQLELVEIVEHAPDGQAMSKLVRGWVGGHGLVVRECPAAPDERGRLYRFYDGRHAIGASPTGGMAIVGAGLADEVALVDVVGEQVRVLPAAGQTVSLEGRPLAAGALAPVASGEQLELPGGVVIELLDAEALASHADFQTPTVREIFQELAIDARPQATLRAAPEPPTVELEQAARPEAALSTDRRLETARTRLRQFWDRESDRLSAAGSSPRRERQPRLVAPVATGATLAWVWLAGWVCALLAAAALALAASAPRPRSPRPLGVDRARPRWSRGAPASSSAARPQTSASIGDPVPDDAPADVSGRVARVLRQADGGGSLRFEVLLDAGAQLVLLRVDGALLGGRPLGIEDRLRVVGRWRRLSGPPVRAPGEGAPIRRYVEVGWLSRIR